VVSPGQELDDSKIEITRDDIETTQTVFRQTLESLAPYVEANGRPAAAVITGDLTYRCTPEGSDAFISLLAERSDVLPDHPARVLAVPGNHDVDWKKLGSSSSSNTLREPMPATECQARSRARLPRPKERVDHLADRDRDPVTSGTPRQLSV
jgi:hypothetical protein